MELVLPTARREMPSTWAWLVSTVQWPVCQLRGHPTYPAIDLDPDTGEFTNYHADVCPCNAVYLERR